jgi:two-component system, NarL family, nitrate/nitrite response regulator NarL
VKPSWRVLIADDHAPTREDIRRVLDRDERFEVCAEAADAAEAVQAALRERPDVCLLDLSMPGGGLAALWEIASRLPEAKIVVLTVSDNDASLFAALRAACRGTR